ncbi:MAG: hypothetical protein KC416_16200, partial [Myxococcales bacterium]|nr:hypothetical protein [Myxococcales bacterium]
LETAGHLRYMQTRLKRMTSPQEFLESGLFMELRGFKLTLRNDLLHPDVLYRVGCLNIELANRIDEWIRSGAIEAKELHQTLKRQSAEADEAFAPTSFKAELAEITKRADQRKERAEKVAQEQKVAARERRTRTKSTKLLVAAMAAIIGALFVAVTASRDRAVLQEAPANTIIQLSPFLASGMLSQGAPPQVFYGQLVGEFPSLSPKKQRAVLDDIYLQLKMNGYENAFIKTGDSLAMQVFGGKRVIFVAQPKATDTGRGFQRGKR